MKYGYITNAWGSVVGHPVGVTSIKDLFYLSTGSSTQALRDISDAGYTGVEIFDGNLLEFENDKNTFRRLMLDHKLELVAVYTGANFIFPDILREELWRIDKAAAMGAELGAKHLTVGGGAKRSTGTTDDDYWQLAEGLDQVVKIASRYGLTASYHPHLTTIVETPAQLEKVMIHSSINFCPDTAHLAAGGGDPVELVKQYFERIKHVHLKGFQPEPFAFTKLAAGTLDNGAVLRALEERGYNGYVMVEADGCAGDPRQNAISSFEYLKKFEVVRV